MLNLFYRLENKVLEELSEFLGLYNLLVFELSVEVGLVFFVKNERKNFG